MDNQQKTNSKAVSNDEISLDEPQNDKNDTFGLLKEDISLISDIISGSNCDFDLEKSEQIERINESFAEGFGDVIIELDSNQYKIIEDYQEDVEIWLSKIKK